jgi:hypothetical protein
MMRLGRPVCQWQIVDRALGDLPVSMDGIGPRGDFIGSPQMIVCIVELVNRLMVAIRKDCCFAFVRVVIRGARLV